MFHFYRISFRQECVLKIALCKARTISHIHVPNTQLGANLALNEKSLISFPFHRKCLKPKWQAIFPHMCRQTHQTISLKDNKYSRDEVHFLCNLY